MCGTEARGQRASSAGSSVRRVKDRRSKDRPRHVFGAVGIGGLDQLHVLIVKPLNERHHVSADDQRSREVLQRKKRP